MGEREHLVYQAKLAEQAERYDGKRVGSGSRPLSSSSLQANGAALAAAS